MLAWTLALGSTVALILGCSMPGSTLPSVGPQGVDKWAHFLGFSFWAMAWLLALDADWPSALVVLVAGALFGGTLELAQSYLPWKRSAELADWIADVAGTGVSCLVWWSLRRKGLLTFLRPRVDEER